LFLNLTFIHILYQRAFIAPCNVNRLLQQHQCLEDTGLPAVVGTDEDGDGLGLDGGILVKLEILKANLMEHG